jgi:hypothetical protein
MTEVFYVTGFCNSIHRLLRRTLVRSETAVNREISAFSNQLSAKC